MLEVEDPVIRKIRLRVQRRFDLMVVSQGGVRYLDEQDHVVRSSIREA